MKRIFCALLAAAMLLLPCMALADVILEPEDSFYKRHSDQCTYQAGRVSTACLAKMVMPRAFSSASVSKNASRWSTRPSLRMLPAR